ncbi:hypothetical protein OAM92_01520 [Acidimicrobiales bacterium]|nr:hypothetical protein [Acidimicrobiales bacterium]
MAFRGRLSKIETTRMCTYFVDTVCNDEIIYSTDEIDVSMAPQRHGWTSQ